MHINVTPYQVYKVEYVRSENSYLIHRLMPFRRIDALKCDYIKCIRSNTFAAKIAI